jgi:hypothetical protein
LGPQLAWRVSRENTGYKILTGSYRAAIIVSLVPGFGKLQDLARGEHPYLKDGGDYGPIQPAPDDFAIGSAHHDIKCSRPAL